MCPLSTTFPGWKTKTHSTETSGRPCGTSALPRSPCSKEFAQSVSKRVGARRLYFFSALFPCFSWTCSNICFARDLFGAIKWWVRATQRNSVRTCLICKERFQLSLVVFLSPEMPCKQGYLQVRQVATFYDLKEFLLFVAKSSNEHLERIIINGNLQQYPFVQQRFLPSPLNSIHSNLFSVPFACVPPTRVLCSSPAAL